MLIFVACIVSLLFPNIGAAKTDKISIISSSDSSLYNQIIEIVKRTVKNSSSRPVTFNTFYIDNLTPAESESINHSDLLVSIGRRAMLSIQERKKSPPILATLIPRRVFKQHQSSLKKINSKVTAIYIDLRPERQILLAKLLLGKLRTLAILLSDKSSTDKRDISFIVRKAGLRSHIENVSTSSKIIRKLSHALEDSDALLALPDPLIFNRNTARNILLTAYRQRVPIIGFSANYVKAGALAAAFATPEQIARQTGETIAKILSNSSTFPHGGKYPEDFDIAVNLNVARSLGINTPPTADLKKKLKSLLETYK